jgi:hypothetical protein
MFLMQAPQAALSPPDEGQKGPLAVLRDAEVRQVGQ